jgi:DNA topoisomerase-1
LDIGKFGPYIRVGKETRSIPADIAMFDLTYDGAIKLLSEEKSNSRQPKTIKDLGDGIEVKEGRYGMYITNGKVNVKMPKDATPDTLILDDAKKLISEKKPKPKRKFKRK